jgi:alkylhydroperoxidase family enzyme
MAWIKQVPVAESAGLLKQQFDAAIETRRPALQHRACDEREPAVMKDSIGLYLTLMHDDSALTRVQRELIATVVSAELGCHY